jgi:hypothetical protein
MKVELFLILLPERIQKLLCLDLITLNREVIEPGVVGLKL